MVTWFFFGWIELLESPFKIEGNCCREHGIPREDAGGTGLVADVNLLCFYAIRREIAPWALCKGAALDEPGEFTLR